MLKSYKGIHLNVSNPKTQHTDTAYRDHNKDQHLTLVTLNVCEMCEEMQNQYSVFNWQDLDEILLHLTNTFQIFVKMILQPKCKCFDSAH